jgi:hypothetical protein
MTKYPAARSGGGRAVLADPRDAYLDGRFHPPRWIMLNKALAATASSTFPPTRPGARRAHVARTHPRGPPPAGPRSNPGRPPAQPSHAPAHRPPATRRAPACKLGATSRHGAFKCTASASSPMPPRWQSVSILPLCSLSLSPATRAGP